MKKTPESPKSIGLVETYKLNGLKLKQEPSSEIALYTAGLLSRIFSELPNPDLNKIYSEARAEIESSKDTDPMTPVARSLMNKAIEFLEENLEIQK